MLGHVSSCALAGNGTEEKQCPGLCCGEEHPLLGSFGHAGVTCGAVAQEVALQVSLAAVKRESCSIKQLGRKADSKDALM